AGAKLGAARTEALVVCGIEDLLERAEAVDRDPDAIALRPGRAIGVPLVHLERDALRAQRLSEEQPSEPCSRDQDWLSGAHDWRLGIRHEVDANADDWSSARSALIAA